MERLEKEILKISPGSAVEGWTEDAAGDDYYMALNDQEEEVAAIHALIKKNLKAALKSKNKYIKAFAECIQDNPNEFQEGIDHVKELNERMPIFAQEEFKKHTEEKKKKVGLK